MIQGLFKYKQPKRYAEIKRRKDSKMYLGYDYSKTLLKNAISQHILRNETMGIFVSFIQDYYMNTIKQIRIMKNWKNITVEKDDKYIR
tara:strand:+ start:81 stop:344 length:264 start_codon:yes stop_codon:yes gene_type:complete